MFAYLNESLCIWIILIGLRCMVFTAETIVPFETDLKFA
jgi:hypothetical protein